ncbi:unnamed protein product [Fraxinus pennsylvanica]|uniref:Uncharacterized protein n=1 Tax=Fraxinus pennsylvanica TaxID=56036 RepID=A0AAD1Z837_9LAMI|nr:unnamed protein product [Fraxinus pennsylvanica]
MAALSIGHLCPIPDHQLNSVKNSRKFISACSQNRDPSNAKTKKESNEKNKGIVQQLYFGMEKLGGVVMDNLSPKQKGDWKDITLMCLSFAVYVYMSQKIVCAYCAWMSILR